MAEKKIERIAVYVREHLEDNLLEQAIAAAYDAPPKRSTIGVKIHVEGEVYGSYLCFTKPTLSASEVAQGINELLEDLLKEVIHNG